MPRSIFNIPIDPETIVYKGRTWKNFTKDIFDSETNYNAELFINSHTSFEAQFDFLFSELPKEIPIYSIERMLAALRAATHDLLRYAVYHNIEFLPNQFRYDISPAVRASVYMKWISSFRPYNFDCIQCDQYSNPDIAVRSNELASNIYASHALALEKNKEVANIDEFLQQEEYETYMYSLRYRIKHQDTYSLFSRRLWESVE
jgi:hypothetical protein